MPCHTRKKRRLLHLALSCITFTVGQVITFSVKMYLLYLRLVLHLALICTTFTVDITFSVVITLSGDTAVMLHGNVSSTFFDSW